MDPTRRFADRVGDYVRYRPRYPRELIPLLARRAGLKPASVVADIGSGTGFSAEPFLQFGNIVYGVEPNAEMRAAGEALLAGYEAFHSIAGTAEHTTLPDSAFDLVTAGQAFHWFERARARAEFERILKPGARITLFWNRRDTDHTPFARAYEALLLQFGTDYQHIRHDNLNADDIGGFLGSDFHYDVLHNAQVLDYEGVKGRLLSSSYTPAEDDPARAPMLALLRELFDRHQQQGRVTIDYETDIYISR